MVIACASWFFSMCVQGRHVHLASYFVLYIIGLNGVAEGGCYFVLFCAILCYFVLFCAILCYFVLFCAILGSSATPLKVIFCETQRGTYHVVGYF